MASDLLLVACRTLEAPSSSPAMKTSAVDALLSALGGGLSLPAMAGRLIWSFWRASPSNRSWRQASGIGDIPDETIRAEAIAVLDDGESGEELRDLAVDVLVGSAHARHIEDRFILALVERVQGGEHARNAVRLIEAVHAARGITPEILRMIRDRWAASPVATVRQEAIGVAAEIAEPDLLFVGRMIDDPDVEVRSSVAHALEMAFPGRELALGLLEGRLRVEVHARARAAFLRAQAAVVEDLQDEGRRRRRR